MRARVVVIGGGLVGGLVALRLADAGADVVVLERSSPGAEASSAAGGILGAQAEASAPGPLFDLAVASRALHAQLADELRQRTGVDVGYRRCGVLELAADGPHAVALEQRFVWQRARGHEVLALDGAELRAREPALAPSFSFGVLLPGDGAVDPARLTHAVAAAAARAGAAYRLGVEARRVRVAAGRARGVETDDGVVEGDAVVVCAGAWSGLVEGALIEARAVRPARGQILELAAHPAPLTSVVFTRDGYLVPHVDGRVLAGSTLEFVRFRRGVTAAGLAKLAGLAATTVPALADAEVTRSWSSFRPYTPDGLPLLGATSVAGLVVATGHYRNGILLAPVTAEVVRDLVTAGRTARNVAPFAPERPSLRAVDA